jgi:hypothetical protein
LHSSFATSSAIQNKPELPSISEFEFERSPKEMKLFQRLQGSFIPKVLIFIDADNSLIALLEIEKFLLRDPSFRLHVLVCFSNLVLFEKIAQQEWLDLFCAQSSIKNAADFALCMHIAALNMSVDDNVTFVLISKDEFGVDALKWTLFYKPTRPFIHLKEPKEIFCYLSEFNSTQCKQNNDKVFQQQTHQTFHEDETTNDPEDFISQQFSQVVKIKEVI